jgi:uncharacterized membrane protein YfcA
VGNARTVILLALAAMTVAFIAMWFVLARRTRREEGDLSPVSPTPFELLIGFVTNFFDTLGIGSFAPTTSIFKLRRMMPDEQIPGTLNVGHTLPTFAEALIFIAAVEVETTTLVSMIAASVLGAWLGAGVVSGLPRRTIQAGMGFALFVAAVLFALKNLNLVPGGGEAFALEGWRFWAGVGGNFVLGVLMTLGIGLYGPCMILVSLLGMHPIAAFPIMMGSCAFLMPVASVRFIQKRSYDRRAALGLGLGGVPGVLIAAYIVKSLSLVALRWGVVVVVLYTAGAMLRSAIRSSRDLPEDLRAPAIPGPSAEA